MSQTTPDSEQIAKMRANPSEFFDRPEEVVAHKGLDVEQKIEILESWATDEDLLLTATAENMEGGEKGHLHRVRKLLDELKRKH